MWHSRRADSERTRREERGPTHTHKKKTCIQDTQTHIHIYVCDAMDARTHVRVGPK